MLTVGEMLKAKREDLGINLSDIEKQIKVREKFLRAVEENNWDFFSSKIYITGIIKNYATFLGLNPQKLLAFFRRDYERKEDVHFKRRVASSYLTSETKKVAVLGIAALFIIFFGYFTYQLKTYLIPPKVEITSPKTSTILDEDKVKIIGKTDKDATITIFGERVFQNKDGIFEYDFPLKPGKNELIIEVIGANGKRTILKRIFYRKTEPGL